MFSKICLLLITATTGQQIDFPLSDKEHKIAAGYYTESGRYKGGIPKRSGELETYVCNEYAYDSTNSTAIACVDWSVNEFGGGETETGSCTCGSFNDRYCSGYSCYTVEEDTDPRRATAFKNRTTASTAGRGSVKKSTRTRTWSWRSMSAGLRPTAASSVRLGPV